MEQFSKIHRYSEKERFTKETSKARAPQFSTFYRRLYGGMIHKSLIRFQEIGGSYSP